VSLRRHRWRQQPASEHEQDTRGDVYRSFAPPFTQPDNLSRRALGFGTDHLAIILHDHRVFLKALTARNAEIEVVTLFGPPCELGGFESTLRMILGGRQ
jgi:hypothetical protein